jgi:hypothetical protein
MDDFSGDWDEMDVDDLLFLIASVVIPICFHRSIPVPQHISILTGERR